MTGERALAGHHPPFAEQEMLPLERLHYSGTCRTSYASGSANAGIEPGRILSRPAIGADGRGLSL